MWKTEDKNQFNSYSSFPKITGFSMIYVEGREINHLKTREREETGKGGEEGEMEREEQEREGRRGRGEEAECIDRVSFFFPRLK